jgi:Phage capsid-like protein/Cyclic nucleotide-binding domain
VTETIDPALAANGNHADADRQRRSLTTAAARNLATTTKSVPQMQAVTSRWLLRMLPWVQVSGGTYRVNRRLSYAIGSGRVSFSVTGDDIRVIPPTLRELRPLAALTDEQVLAALASRFTRKDYRLGEAIVEAGQPADRLVLIAHGKVAQIGVGKYGHQVVLGTLADGEHFGEEVMLAGNDTRWDFTAMATTPCIVFSMGRQDLQRLARQYAPLRQQLAASPNGHGPLNAQGEAEIEVASGHQGEQELPGTFVDYEAAPREYELSVAQTVLHVHSRVADLYNDPMNQVEHQLRLTIEALRERQEDELINNPDIGLLRNADLSQRLHTRTGPPTPDDMDELLASVWKDPGFFLAHPRTIAAFGRECTNCGIYPQTAQIGGHSVPAWRGIPILPCNKIPVTSHSTSSVMLMRVGEENRGVVGLHQTGIPDEYEPSLSVRFMGIDEEAIIAYLVSAYYSVAVLVPDALGVLENVEIGH